METSTIKPSDKLADTITDGATIYITLMTKAVRGQAVRCDVVRLSLV